MVELKNAERQLLNERGEEHKPHSVLMWIKRDTCYNRLKRPFG